MSPHGVRGMNDEWENAAPSEGAATAQFPLIHTVCYLKLIAAKACDFYSCTRTLSRDSEIQGYNENPWSIDQL